MRRSLVYIGIAALLFSVTYYIYRVQRYKHEIELELNSDYWKTRVAIFRAEPIEYGKCILLGNSIIKGFPASMTGNHNILNRGVAGDFSEGVLKRLDEVLRRKPAKLFIEIGINDILAKVPLTQISENYELIILKIKEQCPETKVYIISNLPVSLKSSLITRTSDINERVQRQNVFLHDLCSRYKLTYINLHPRMMHNGKLNTSYTDDGLHLNNQGYEVFYEVLKPLLEN